jgi:pyruvate dehydrogenase E1 component
LNGLFKAAGIYAPEGQHYTPVDANSLLPYREASDGQILQEGICEVGAMASFQAAGTAYAVHGLPMIPFYIFYSIFGFQRVGDMIWSCGDVLCRGFLLGGTAGRTTLNGEGLQHQDGHSHVVASTIPNLKSYDPAFAGEVAIIVREGIRRMYQEQEDLMYYITVYNEAYSMPAVSDDAAVRDGIIRGGYRYRKSSEHEGEQVHLLSSGSVMQQALEAATLLQDMGYRVDIWSITSFVELERDIQACERWNRLHPAQPPKRTHVESMFADIEHGVGSFVAVTDYMKRLATGISKYVPGHFQVLGTDGYGVSESRPELRDHFEISPAYISQAAIAGLYAESRIDKPTMLEQLDGLPLCLDKSDPACR